MITYRIKSHRISNSVSPETINLTMKMIHLYLLDTSKFSIPSPSLYVHIHMHIHITSQYIHIIILLKPKPNSQHSPTSATIIITDTLGKVQQEKSQTSNTKTNPNTHCSTQCIFNTTSQRRIRERPLRLAYYHAILKI